MTPDQINKIIETPEWDKYSAIKTQEARFIYNFIIENKLRTSLETGFAFGKSTSHIIAATNNVHVAIDPFQDRYDRIGLKNIDKLNYSSKLEFYEDYSHNVLPNILQIGRRFDFIFIDGDHKFDGILLDFYYADLLLEENGYILLHDTWLRSTRLVANFIKMNKKNYKEIHTPLRNFILIKKIGQDKRDGIHFKEFYTFRSIIINRLINWMSNGKQNLFKKIAFKIKKMYICTHKLNQSVSEKQRVKPE